MNLDLTGTPRKQKAILERLIGSEKLTVEGMEWLTVATDPFHDCPVPASGYPDMTTSNSITQCYTRTMSLSAPASVIGTSNTWEAHIFFLPITPNIGKVQGANLNFDYLRTASVDYFNICTPTSTNLTTFYSGWNALALKTGLPSWQSPLSNISGSDSNFLTGIKQEVNWYNGQARLVATGCEVVNTTAALYMNGTQTWYRSPGTKGNSTISLTGSPNETLFESVPFPPSSAQDAALFPNSGTRSAVEGTYMVGALNDLSNPFTVREPKIVGGMCEYGSDSNQVFANARNALVPPIPDYGTNTGGCNRVIPFDVTGVIYSGLSSQTTLQVTVRYFIEQVPSITDPKLLTLSRPPASFDHNALLLYQRALRYLPVACAVSENPEGEWWRQIASILGDLAPIIGTAFTPMLGPVGPALGMGAQALLKSYSEPQQNNAPKINANAPAQTQSQQRRRGPRPKPPPKPAKMRAPPVQGKQAKPLPQPKKKQ